MSNTVDVDRRSLDRRAVLAGTVVVGVLIGLVVATPLPRGLVVLGSLVGGAVTGWISRTFEGEALDGAVATLAGTFLAPFVVAAVVWTGTAALPAAQRIDISLGIVLLGLGAALVVGLFTAPLGAFTAYLAATARRRLSFVSDTLET